MSQIATFGTMAAKAVVRDVGRVLDLRLQLLRPAREADPVPAGQADHARRMRARWSRCSPSARRSEEEVQRAARARREARGPGAQRRHARGRRADRAGQAHRLLPAVRRRRRGQRHLAARQGRRRGGRPGEVRLPRPHHADHPRLGRALRAAAWAEADFALEQDAARRRRDLQAAFRGQHHRGVPVGIARHARPASSARGPTASRTSSRWSRSTARARWT